MSLQLPLNKLLSGLRMIPISTCRPSPGFLVLLRNISTTTGPRLNYNKRSNTPVSSTTSLFKEQNSKWLSSQQSQSQEQQEDIPNATDQSTQQKEESVKEGILEAALNHVNSQGWNVNAISYGATDLGLSPSVSGIFKDIDLVHFFLIKSNDALEFHLGNLSSPSTPKISVEEALLFRLQQVFPYAPRYSEAIVHLLTPQNAPQSTKLLLELADTIAHYSLGDSSTDTTWYIRRLNIARLYVEAELCLVQDSSPEFTQTREFVKRRLSSVSSLDTPQLLPSPQSIRMGLVTVANLFRINAPR